MAQLTCLLSDFVAAGADRKVHIWAPGGQQGASNIYAWNSKCLSVGQGGNGAFSPGKINKIIDSLGKSLVELNFGCHWALMRRVEAFFNPLFFQEENSHSSDLL